MKWTKEVLEQFKEEGKKHGKKRFLSMTPEQISAYNRMVANKRWKKYRKKKSKKRLHE